MPTDKKKRDQVAKEMGKRLAAARDAKGLTQAQLAAATGWTQEAADAGKAVGVSPSAIGNYEQGTRRLGNEEAEAFAAVLDVASAYLMALVDETVSEVIIAMRRRPDRPLPTLKRRRPA